MFREWLGTRTELHPEGANAYVLQLGIEPPALWTADLPEGTARFKEQPHPPGPRTRLGHLPAIEVNIQKGAQRPAAPTNLRVFEDGAHPTYTAGQDIAVN